MVKFVRRMAFLDAFKDVYHKSFWKRIKHLWSVFKESNQVVATYAPFATIIFIPLIGVITYRKIHANPTPRYYDHICIYRPDDPRAALIRKDSSLKYSVAATFDSIHMPDTI